MLIWLFYAFVNGCSYPNSPTKVMTFFFFFFFFSAFSRENEDLFQVKTFFFFFFWGGGLSAKNVSAPLRNPKAPQCPTPPTGKILATPLFEWN